METTKFEPGLLEFLRNTVAEQLMEFPKCGLEYYGFSIVMQCIEVTGSLFDTKTIDDFGECENRFQKGFEFLFPNPPYKGQWKTFFTELRGPLIHQMRPAWDFTLTRESKTPSQMHFHRDQQGQTILVFEELVRGLKEGLDRLIRQIADAKLSEKIDATKLKGRHIIVYSVVGDDSHSCCNEGLSARPNYDV